MSLGVGTKDGLFDRRDFCGNDKFSDDVLWRFDLAHSLSLGVFVLCNYLCVLHALVSFYLSVGFQKNAIFFSFSRLCCDVQ